MAFEEMNGPTNARIAIRSGDDVPGAAEAVAAWREVLTEADALIYLFRADQIYDADTAHANRVREDARVISEIASEQGTKVQAASMVGTHYDLVPGYRGPLDGSDFYSFHMAIEEDDTIRDSRQIMAGSVAGDRRVGLVVGSMKTKALTQELAFRLFVRELKLRGLKL
jgi:hypothetical protein